ncbi:MAG: ABC transporter permease [Clostridia bacterium]|nr:ABC transporter permease [Clostridia bacterium]
MLALYKKELRGYFISPVGFVFAAAFLIASALTVSYLNLSQATTDLSGYFTAIIFMFVVLIPLLTMRLLSEEKKTRTDQILLTSPVSLSGIIMAKFFSALTLFALTLLVSTTNFIVLFAHGTPNAARIFSMLLGTLLIGSAFIAIGLFISALTESQLSSAVITIFSLLGMEVLGLVSSSIQNDALRTVVRWISIFDRFNGFANGVLDISALIYYFSITVVFLFLCVRVMEKRRWE